MSLFSKKKVLVLFGSPQSHGTTRKLLDSFLSGFHQNKDWSVEEVSLYELSPIPAPGAGPAPKRRAVPSTTWMGWTSPCGLVTCWWWPLPCTTVPFRHP